MKAVIRTFLLLLIIGFALGYSVDSVWAQQINNKAKAVSTLSPASGSSTDTKNAEKKGGKAVQLEDFPDDVSVVEFKEGKPKSKRKYIYEKPTMKNLANLYWALGFLDIENNEHVDNYLKLTECDIYKQYIASEFEWNDIRDATRRFIKKNRDQFPVRFELVQEIKITDYDVKRHAFKINPKYQIQSYRRFQMMTVDSYIDYMFCGGSKLLNMEGYPSGVILELSRPFSLTYVPAPLKVAKEYIKTKNTEFQKLRDAAKKAENKYDLRIAYLVMQVKIFASRKIQKTRDGESLLQTMAILEGYEVYGDPGRKLLFYSKSYLTNQTAKEVSDKIKREYKLLRLKIKGDGMLH